MAMIEKAVTVRLVLDEDEAGKIPDEVKVGRRLSGAVAVILRAEKYGINLTEGETK